MKILDFDLIECMNLQVLHILSQLCFENLQGWLVHHIVTMCEIKQFGIKKKKFQKKKNFFSIQRAL